MNSSKAGMTLTEVMVSVLVFTIAATAIYGLSLSLLRLQDSANRSAEAVRIGENHIEDLIGADFTSVSNASATVGGYTLTRTVRTIATGQKHIEVAVGWSGVDGNARDVEVRTVLIE